MTRLPGPPEQPPRTSADSSRQPSDEIIRKDERLGQPLPMTPVPELLKASMKTKQETHAGVTGISTRAARSHRRPQSLISGVVLQKQTLHRPGQTIQSSGVYDVIHNTHDEEDQYIHHQLICIKGLTFPKCSRCGGDVRFRLLVAYQYVASNEYFEKSFSSGRLGRLLE